MSERDEEPAASAYAGRWVARVQGRIVAHGGSPEQARLAAQHARFKEKVDVSFVPPAIPLSLSPLVERVRAAFPDEELYLVGGAVRDALLGKVSRDLDFVVPRDAIKLARRVADALQADFYVLDTDFDAGRVIVSPAPGSGRSEQAILDFSSFRPGSGSRTLESDLAGRDFTINAMAYDPRADAILDPLNGSSDLRARLLRAASSSALADDPVRILRGVRLAAQLGFKIHPPTRAAMKAAASSLPRASVERQRDELFRLLDGPHPDLALRALDMLGACDVLLPELAAMKGVQQSPPHVADVWEHTLSALHYLEIILADLAPGFQPEQNADLFTGLLSLRLGRFRSHFAQHFGRSLSPGRSLRSLLFLAALYHDISKPEKRTVDDDMRIRFLGHEESGAATAVRRAVALRLSNDEVERLQTIVANHMRFHFHVNRLEMEQRPPTRRAIYRFFRDAGEAGVELVLLGLADLRGTRGHLLTQETWDNALEVARILLENFWDKPHVSVAPPRLLNGNELMGELGLTPGPLVGTLLGAIREAQAAGELDSRDGALAFARSWMEKGQIASNRGDTDGESTDQP